MKKYKQMEKYFYIHFSNQYLEMRVNAWVGVIVLFVLSFGSMIYVTAQLNQIHDEIFTLKNDNNLILSANKISNSTVLILVKANVVAFNDQVSGSIFVDEKGQAWNKGTGFSIGDGKIITAFHVVSQSTNLSNIKIIWKGKEYTNLVSEILTDVPHDFAVLRTNVTIPGVEVIKDETTLQGSRVGFIGFPLNENQPMLNEGVVSSVRQENDGFIWYTISSFVNRGNSGGAVFKTDTGEVIGFISSRQNEGITFPQPNVEKLSEGEKELLSVMAFIAVQQSSNSQVGIGHVVGLNERIKKIIEAT